MGLNSIEIQSGHVLGTSNTKDPVLRAQNETWACNMERAVSVAGFGPSGPATFQALAATWARQVQSQK